MIIAIPVDEKDLNTNLCFSYGRAPLFALYNTETKEARYLDNSAISAQGGAGIKAAQRLIDEKADVLITMRCGQNAADVLEGNIKIYKSQDGTIKENIDLFLDGKLDILDNIHPGFHNHK